MQKAKKAENTIIKIIGDDGRFPNNSKLPVIIYRQAIESDAVSAEIVEALFASNRWRHSWRNGIYPYHHYHSTVHEVLGIYAGRAKVQLGGPEGIPE